MVEDSLSEVTALALAAKGAADLAILQVATHEQICAIRYGNINDSLKKVESFIKWAGTSFAGVTIALLGWMAVELFEANNARFNQVQANRERIDQIERHQSAPLNNPN